MLIHFKGSNKNLDVVVNVTDSNVFEAFLSFTHKKLYVLKFHFTEIAASENYNDEVSARNGIKDKLTLLGFDNAEQLSNDVIFTSDQDC